MRSDSSAVKTYIVAFAWLVIFTAAELFAAGSGIPRHALVAVILATALGKALLIALFFMHLKFENRLVWLLPGIPLFFIIAFVFGLCPDIAWHLTSNF